MEVENSAQNIMPQNAQQKGIEPKQAQNLVPVIQKRGRIELILGCMFSGKTTELIRRTKRHEITQKRVLRVKYATGDSPDITTHAGIKSQAHTVR